LAEQHPENTAKQSCAGKSHADHQFTSAAAAGHQVGGLLAASRL
jgi:hypothetical protein